MKRFIVSMAAGLGSFFMGCCVSSAAEVPEALSRESPALANFNSHAVVAWAAESGVGAHKVRYSTFNGGWTIPTEIPDALTTSAPALGAAAQSLYLASTPPDAENSIYLHMSNNGTTFNAIGPLCDANRCARTLASPALVGDGATLYAAWSTPNGAIMYATLSNGVWSIAPLPIPNALTESTTGPALAVYQNRLYVAWRLPSGQAVSVISATLPLSSSSWSNLPVQVPAPSKVAPALGVFTVASSPASAAQLTQALFLAWTATDSTIKFARWDSQVAQWGASPSPIPLPTGPLTHLPVAINGFMFDSDQECHHSNDLAYLGEGPNHHHKVTVRQVTGGCP